MTEADPRAAHCHHTGVLAPAIPDKPMATASVNGSTRTTKWSPHPGHQPKERTHGRRIEIEFVRKAGKDSARGQPSGALTSAMEKANTAEVTQKLPQRTKTVEDHDPRGAPEA